MSVIKLFLFLWHTTTDEYTVWFPGCLMQLTGNYFLIVKHSLSSNQVLNRGGADLYRNNARNGRKYIKKKKGRRGRNERKGQQTTSEKYGGWKRRWALFGSRTFIMSVSLVLGVEAQLDIAVRQQKNQQHCHRLDLHYKKIFHPAWPVGSLSLFLQLLPSSCCCSCQKEILRQ